MEQNDNAINETLVAFGGEIKATELDDGSVKLGGYLVRFSTADDPDLTGDFFTANTHFGAAAKSWGWFNHRLPVTFEDESVEYKDQLPDAELTKDDAGIFAEIVLKARNAYEKQIARLGLAKKLSWSSGTAPHLVDRKQVGNVCEILSWPLGLDASLTPTPAEPRNGVIPLKSLVTVNEAASADKSDTREEPIITPAVMPKESEMEAEELKGLLEGFKADIKTEFENAVKKYADEHQPEVKAGFAITDVKDEADRALEGNPWKLGEFFKAVKNAALQPYSIDQRLLPLKATGLNEAIPSQGGFLVPPQMAAGIQQRMYPVGSLLARLNPVPVVGNSMTFNKIDETSRADGSRYGGIQGYWLNEAGTKTASHPTFSQVELKLKKVAALCYATDELLEDTAALESWITTYVPQELQFKVEDAIMNGDGVGKPFGILSSTALVSATRTDATEVDNMDVFRMWSRRWVGANDYVWLICPDVAPQLYSMVVGQVPVYTPPGGLTQAPYGTLLGRPIIETEYQPALGTLGDILLFSPSQYAMIIKSGGIQSASSIHVAFTTDETAFRFVYRVDGQPFWDAALTPFNGGNTVSPYVGLAAST